MAGKDRSGVELGNLKILNVAETLSAGTEEDFTFNVPSGGVAELREATYHLKRSTPLNGITDGYTSEDVKIKSLEVTKVGASEKTNLLSGTPNIKEFGGDGRLTRLFTVVETLENNESIIIKVRNDDTVDVRVSLTLTLAIFPRERRIAGQPGMDIDISR